MVVTRFAPSPTGYLHIGSARTALFNYLYAKNQGGKFLLRIEDTDQKRSSDDAVRAIFDSLKWLDIDYDGEVVYQSENIENHRQTAFELLKNGHAYWCYLSKEELEEGRLKNSDKGFRSSFRDKKLGENEVGYGCKPVLRIKVPDNGSVYLDDKIQGKVEVECQQIDDFVILRSDLTPTYMLAVVADDLAMKVTIVIRGDDHLTNTFKQKIIYDALGEKMPKMAHIPLIYGNDGAKMSKRHGAVGAQEYQKMGYLSCAMRNYLLRLGWSHGNDEIISDQQAVKWFGLKNIGKSPARFDFSKLDHLNQHYINQIKESELFEMVLPFLLKYLDVNAIKDVENFLKALIFVKKGASNLVQIAQNLVVYDQNYQDSNKLADFADKIAENRQVVERIRKELVDLDENSWNLDQIKRSLMQFAADNSLKIKDFGPILRILLTFSDKSPGGIFEIVTILGKNIVNKRLSQINAL